MYEREDLLKRIVINPEIMVGKPIIKDTRLTVQHILGLLAQGITMHEILKEYANLTLEDIIACLFFAMETIDNTAFVPVAVRTV